MTTDNRTSAEAIITRHTTGVGPQHDAHVVAASLGVVTGEAWEALCCWCLDRAEHRERAAFRVYRNHGECAGCAYVGRDVLVAHPS